jgi:Tol biopolymer transport system component
MEKARRVGEQRRCSSSPSGGLLWFAAVFLACLIALGPPARAGTTERVSVSSSGEEGNAQSGLPCVSADGRFVAFHSGATNLVPGDTNGWADVFVHDRLTGTTDRVSVSSSGEQANWTPYALSSKFPSISSDGRFVAFSSFATNLVPGDTNGREDVFVHDRLTGVTERVSVSSSGQQGNADSLTSSISADGRFVAFCSLANNLLPGDTNGCGDIFVHDRLTGATERVSVSSSGEPGNGGSYDPCISQDGRFVAFDSWSSNLVPGDTNGFEDVFVRDRGIPCPERPPSPPHLLSVRQLTNWPDALRSSAVQGINHDGTRVLLLSDANLTGENTSGLREVFVVNADGTGLRQLTHGAGGAEGGWMSGNGEMMSFASPGDLTGQNSDHSWEAFVVSWDGSTLRQLTFNPDPTYQCNFNSRISHDGQWVCFSSDADLTGENPDHNRELFVASTDGADLRQLTHEPDPAYNVQVQVCMSPNGQRIGFGSTSDPLGLNPDHSQEVFVISRDGSGLTQVTQNPDPARWFDMAVGGMTWDGGTLLIYGTANVTGQNPDGSREVFIVNADGSGLRQLTCDSQFDSFTGAMSYDGRIVSFRSRADFTGQNPDHSQEAFIMNCDGSRLTQVSRYDGPGSPGVLERLSGDGNHMAFSSSGNETGGNPDGGREAFVADIQREMRAVNTQGVPGNPVTVPITLDDATDVAGVQFDLVYDPAILTNAAAQKGALIAGDPDWLLAYNVITPGRIRVLAYNQHSQPLGPGGGTIAECTFTVSPSATRGQTSPLDIQNPVLSDEDGGSIPVVGIDGVFTVIAVHHFVFDTIPSPQHGDATTPLAFGVTVWAKDQNGNLASYYNDSAILTDLTATLDLDPGTSGITEATAPFIGGIYTGSVVIRQPIQVDRITAVDALDPSATGVSNDFKVIGEGDPNGDGEVNVQDVVRTVNIALEVPPPPTDAEFAAADVNEDGRVDVRDVIIIQNIILGPHGGGGGEMLSLHGKASARGIGPVVATGKPPAPGAKKIGVPVLIDSAQGVAGFNFDLAYDSKALSPVEVRAGALISGKPDWLVNGNLAKNPLRVLAFSSQSLALSGKGGTLVEVVFAETGKGGADSVRLSGTVISDSAGNSLPRAITLGKARAVK